MMAGHKVVRFKFTVMFDSSQITRNGDIFVAYMMVDNPLPEEYFPLRLVGADLSKEEMLGQISKIILHLPEGSNLNSATTSADADSNPIGENQIYGALKHAISLSAEGLAGFTQVRRTIQKSDGEKSDYTGILLSTLLEAASPDEDATVLLFAYDDISETQVYLAEILDCKDCMVSIQADRRIDLLLPGFPAAWWITGITHVEVK